MDEIIKTLKTISTTHNTRMNNHANNLQKQLNDIIILRIEKVS